MTSWVFVNEQALEREVVDLGSSQVGLCAPLCPWGGTQGIWRAVSKYFSGKPVTGWLDG